MLKVLRLARGLVFGEDDGRINHQGAASDGLVDTRIENEVVIPRVIRGY